MVTESEKKESEEVEKPRRRFSGNQPPEMALDKGKTNLSFVLEESEDEDKDSSAITTNTVKKTGVEEEFDDEVFSKTPTGEGNNKGLPEAKEVVAFGENETNNNNNNANISGLKGKNKAVSQDNNGNATSKRHGSVASVTTDNGINNNNVDRRRSSAEVIRQSRAYKRFSKALSQISLGPSQSKDIVYQLDGMDEEVSLTI
jgi:hypothetical protein